MTINKNYQLMNMMFDLKWNFRIKKRYLFFLTTILASFMLITSCTGDDEDFSQTGTHLSVSDISGSWIATQATFIGTDLLADGGKITLVIQNNGHFTFTMKIPGEPDEISTGKLGFDGEYLAVRFDDDPGEEASFSISLINQILTLRGQTELDINGDGIEEFGILALVMERS